MPQDERGLYFPWYPTRYLLGRTRFLLSLPERSIYRDILDMLYEAGGEICNDPEYLCAFTGANRAQLDNVLNSGGFSTENKRLRHRIVDDIIAEVAELRDTARRGGLKSAEVRKSKYGTAQPSYQHLSTEDDPNPLRTPPSNPPSNLKEVRKEGSKEGSKGSATPKTDGDNFHGSAPKNPGQVKPGVASDPKIKNQDPTPERLADLIETCRATTHLNADRSRPWLTAQSGSWYSRQPVHVQVAFERAFIERYGFGLDAGPSEDV